MYDMKKRDRLDSYPKAGTKADLQDMAAHEGITLAALLARSQEQMAEEWRKSPPGIALAESRKRKKRKAKKKAVRVKQ